MKHRNAVAIREACGKSKLGEGRGVPIICFNAPKTRTATHVAAKEQQRHPGRHFTYLSLGIVGVRYAQYARRPVWVGHESPERLLEKSGLATFYIWIPRYTSSMSILTGQALRYDSLGLQARDLLSAYSQHISQ